MTYKFAAMEKSVPLFEAGKAGPIGALEITIIGTFTSFNTGSGRQFANL
jgi:hypothetical protein